MGLIILIAFIAISIGYSLSREVEYEGQVSVKVGRVANIPSVTKIATLNLLNKDVWRLFERNDTILLVSKKAFIKTLETVYGTSERPGNLGFVISATSESSDLVVIRVRAVNPNDVEKLLNRIVSDVENAHSVIYSGYLDALSNSLETLQELIDEVEEDARQLVEEVSNEHSIGQALLLQYRAELLIRKDQMEFLRLPPHSMPTEFVGDVVIGIEPVEPDLIKHLLFFLILGLAVAVALPLAFSLWLSHRS